MKKALKNLLVLLLVVSFTFTFCIADEGKVSDIGWFKKAISAIKDFFKPVAPSETANAANKQISDVINKEYKVGEDTYKISSVPITESQLSFIKDNNLEVQVSCIKNGVRHEITYPVDVVCSYKDGVLTINKERTLKNLIFWVFIIDFKDTLFQAKLATRTELDVLRVGYRESKNGNAKTYTVYAENLSGFTINYVTSNDSSKTVDMKRVIKQNGTIKIK